MDIFKHLKGTELAHQPNASCMKNQKDINNKIRAILVDWLVDVHLKFKLLPETLFITINIMDRYLEREVVTKQTL